jgi:alanine racemase
MDIDCRTWLEIDLDAIIANLRMIAGRVAPCKLLAVVKGDAYGMGARQVASAAVESGAVAILGVATLEEALELVDVPLPKQIISAVLPSEIPEAVRHGFILPVEDAATAEAISAEALRQKRTAPCGLKIDTGMGRLGMLAEQALPAIRKIAALPGLRIAGMFTHLACAGNLDDPFTIGQIGAIRELAAGLSAAGVVIPELHCAASDAIVNYPESYAAPFTFVRPGTAIYGSCFSSAPDLPLVPAVSFKSRLIAVRELPAGHSIGYSRLCRLTRPSRIGVVAAGYCDGVKIPLSNRGYMLLNGKYCPVAGRVSMDYTSILLDGCPEAKVGDEVVMIGGSGDARITVEDWARINGTVTQEILCSFAPRVRRCYISKD